MLERVLGGTQRVMEGTQGVLGPKNIDLSRCTPIGVQLHRVMSWRESSVNVYDS